jgi:hypothetical protein
MPQVRKMFMNLGLNGRPSFTQIQAFAASNSTANASPKPPSHLKANMISRIQGVRSGCGSCGGGGH